MRNKRIYLLPVTVLVIGALILGLRAHDTYRAQDKIRKSINALQLLVPAFCNAGAQGETPNAEDLLMLRSCAGMISCELDDALDESRESADYLLGFARITLKAEFTAWDAAQWESYRAYAQPLLDLDTAGRPFDTLDAALAAYTPPLPLL